MNLLSKATHTAYSVARFLNRARILGALSKGNTRPAVRSLENRLLWRLINRIRPR